MAKSILRALFGALVHWIVNHCDACMQIPKSTISVTTGNSTPVSPKTMMELLSSDVHYFGFVGFSCICHLMTYLLGVFGKELHGVLFLGVPRVPKKFLICHHQRAD